MNYNKRIFSYIKENLFQDIVSSSNIISNHKYCVELLVDDCPKIVDIKEISCQDMYKKDFFEILKLNPHKLYIEELSIHDMGTIHDTYINTYRIEDTRRSDINSLCTSLILPFTPIICVISYPISVYMNEPTITASTAVGTLGWSTIALPCIPFVTAYNIGRILCITANKTVCDLCSHIAFITSPKIHTFSVELQLRKSMINIEDTQNHYIS